MYLCLSEEKILLLFPVYYLAVFMDNYSYAASGDNDDGADIQPVVLPLPATPAPLATAAFADPPAAPLIAEARAVLTGQYYFIVIVDSNSIQLVACVFFYRLCIITIILFLFIYLLLQRLLHPGSMAEYLLLHDLVSNYFYNF